jgi:NAD(P)-dependent dehydrogenase (short-subunit alcohol dehydrogenase family)
MMEVYAQGDFEDAMTKKVWFITGCSTGFGRALARLTLSQGHPTVVTARDPGQVQDLAGAYPELALALKLDVTDPGQVAQAVAAAAARFGTIDVLVNNAGIGYFGSFEESDLEAARRMFEINVWGLAGVTRAVLPLLRAQRSGTIVNISSIAGIAAAPSLSFYNGTKFAVEGLSESLAQEVAPLGIRVLLVEPGPFRTDWAGRSASEAPWTIADYHETAGARARQIRGFDGRQPGDPQRAAAAILQAVEAPEPPQRLLLGRHALRMARLKLAAAQKDFEGWAQVTEGADFPD